MSLSKPFAVLAFLFFAVSTWAAPQARIVRAIDSSQMTQIRARVHPLAQPEFDQGALDPSQILQHVTMFFNRSAAQQQALDQLLQEQQDRTSAYYHQWLTPEDFAARFGMAPSDLAKVQDWMQSQGFTIGKVARGGDFIEFSASVGQINSAFRTEIHQYNINGELHFANATPPAVPDAMAGVVLGFHGLNDFKPRARVVSRKADPRLTSGISGSHFMTPDDFHTIYDLKSVYNLLTDTSGHAIDGTGQSIAVIGTINPSLVLTDVATFRSLSGLPATTVQVVGTSTGNASGDISESALDLEWSGATAPGAKLIFVTASDAFTALTNDAIDNQVAPVISISYGNCEQVYSPGNPPPQESELSKAATQGQTVVGPAGDDGAADCDYPTNSTGVKVANSGLYVDFPASSPYVTGVGGTSFSDSTGTYWANANSVLNGSALTYIPETAWNDTATTGVLDATGGGASVVFSKPSWQTGTGVPADGFRDVPDIAVAGSPEHDSYIICENGQCQVCYPGSSVDTGTAVVGGTGNADGNCPSMGSPGYRQSSTNSSLNYTFNAVGGTSAGVPTFAGIVALLDQQAGTPQGLLNPRLYQLAASSAGSYIFHDITTGDNIVPCTPGTPASGPASIQCPSSGSFGYTAGTGYDQTTGLGSIDAYNLITNWNGPRAADFALMSNTPLVVTHGGTATVPLTLQALNGFNSSVSFTCTSNLPGVTCSLAPSTPGIVNVTLVAASGVAQERRAPSPFVPYWQYSFGLAAFVMMGKKRSKRQIAAIACVAVLLILAMPSCGGGSGGGGNSSVVTPPAMSLTPTSLNLSYTTGGTTPAAQTFNVTSSGASLSYTVAVTTNSGGNWLSATSANSATPGAVSVSVNSSSLAAGTYSGMVTVTSSGANNSPQTVSVTLSVSNPTITVVATSGSITHTTQIPFTVN